MTTTERKEANVMGPYELLDEVKAFIVRTIPEQQFENRICLNEVPHLAVGNCSWLHYPKPNHSRNGRKIKWMQ